MKILIVWRGKWKNIGGIYTIMEKHNQCLFKGGVFWGQYVRGFFCLFIFLELL